RLAQPQLTDNLSGLSVVARSDAGHIVDRVKVVSLQKRRRHKRRAFGTRPDNMCGGNVSFAAGAHRKGRTRASRAAVEETIADDRHWNGLGHVPLYRPEQLPGVG